MNWEQAKELVAEYNVDDLIKIIHACENKIGGVATIITPEDLRNQVDNTLEADEIDMDEAGKQQLVDSIRSSFEWVTGMRSVMEEDAWEVISSAIEERISDQERFANIRS